MEVAHKVTYTKFYPLLVAMATTCMISSLVLLYRLVEVGSFSEPGGVFLFPLAYLIGDVIAEVYGYKLAKKQVLYIGVCLTLYTLMTTIVIYLPSPPSSLHLEQAYKDVMGLEWRACLAFIIAMLVSNWLNVYLISKWRIVIKGKYFWMRMIGFSKCSMLEF